MAGEWNQIDGVLYGVFQIVRGILCPLTSTNTKGTIYLTKHSFRRATAPPLVFRADTPLNFSCMVVSRM